MNKIIYSVGGYDGYLNWLKDMGFKTTQILEEADTVFFAGGADISPSLYGEKCGSRTSFSPFRDTEELNVFRRSKDKFKIGVCRGAQLLTVLAGYKLIQDIDHPYNHEIKLDNGETMVSNSLHHQISLLERNPRFDYSYDYKLLGWAERISNNHLNGEDKDYNLPADYKEVEIVAYTNKSIGFQMHPEMMFRAPNNVEFINHCQELVDKFINNKL